MNAIVSNPPPKAPQVGLAEQSAADLVAGCLAGDPGAQRQLYELYHRRVHGLTTRMVGLQDAADVTQQVFLQVFRKLDQFAGRSGFATWLYRLTVNEALQHLRRVGRRKTQPLSAEPEAPAARPSDRQADRELLERALARLDPQLRSIFLLRETEGLSYRQIAEATQVPEGTVGSRLNRARRELRDHLRDLGWR